jgi:dolichyl-phosphate beta-glucosyltransferase
MSSDPAIYLSVVIPAYNEENRIQAALRDVFSYLATFTEPWEVLVVDDGSRDGTPQIVGEWQRSHAGLRYMALPANQGKGEAVRQGMLAASGKFRLLLDADCSIPLAALDRFLPHLRAGAPVVVGIRVPSSNEKRSLVRRVLGSGFALLCQGLLVPGVRDVTCGFKCFSREAAQAILPLQKTRRWAFDAEVLFLAKRLGLPVVQVRVPWHHETGSHVRLAADVAGSLRELILVRTNAALGRYDPARDCRVRPSSPS